MLDCEYCYDDEYVEVITDQVNGDLRRACQGCLDHLEGDDETH